MNYELVLAILIFIEGMIILKGLLELSKQIDEGLAEMDQTMAEAISKVIQNVGMGEPISPIQNALAQILMNSVNREAPGSNPVGVILEQGADGKFVSKDK